MPHFRRKIAVENKDARGGFDPVTAADRAAERVVRKAIRARFPDHGITGEEYGSVEGSDYRWVIDPIDGTRAFIIGAPMWGTLIGLLADGTPTIGLMSQPFTRERYWSDGKSSRWSGPDGKAKAIRTRPCTRLSSAILTTTHPDLFAGEDAKAFAAVRKIARMTRFGGDCYGYCLLAAGHVDLVIEAGLKPYDIVALIPIIENAGGIVTTWDGRPATDGGRIIAAGDARVHREAMELLQSVTA
jgi:myo-inositol-1(or 4)-monophosphatase